ncbi:MAG: hypothetical protein GYB36_01925 [Alphaproteobacteria bacterium]|nr:hypothetical protein [Alphaproteobacteria bacterium]
MGSKSNRRNGASANEARASLSGSRIKSALYRDTALKRLQPIAAATLLSGMLLATSPAEALNVGDTLTHPTTGATLTVLEVLSNGVITNGNLFILTTTTVGATFTDPDDPNATVEIASVTTNSTTSEIESVTFTDGRVFNVVTTLSAGASAPAGGTITLPSAAGDANVFTDIRRGNGGSGGRDGALFVSARSGGDGATGPSFTTTVAASNGDITTVSANLPGIIAASIGGNGGNGGDGYLGASGASGGRGGAGGNVTLTSNVGSISTTGDGSHGVVAQSRSGIGGRGGSGFLFSSGGSGGAGNDGGNATVNNYSTITTRGVGAHGVLAQSLGGGAGSGGSSYGIFGNGGDGNNGGNGGTAIAYNYASVTTLGNASHGVAAFSTGGIGGDAGNAGGLITFTSDGASGGNGGTARVYNENGGNVRTEGDAAFGLFAQSIGGGGGSGGTSIGLVSLGSGGGTGGDGGSAYVYARSGSSVVTVGESSHAIMSQSIGGGGGNGGVSGGLVAIGSRGTSGGTGGSAFAESAGTTETYGNNARGMFVQSIGGGGGNALGAGGLVALGGSGGNGGSSGRVDVYQLSGGSIYTEGVGSDGIFAQSIGGGGGAGSSTGGVFALGGSGSGGGNGGIVYVSNAGSIITLGNYARGIFAQSVGGGGGSGGDGGGLAAIGGSGGTASAASTVTVINTGTITTGGNLASAIQAQSIGGGGGDGGSTGGVFLTIGGAGGGGGISDTVRVDNSFDLSTGGSDSHGIFAQSVGGGGGSGGSTVSVSAFAGVAIGGSGGAGGNGGEVDLNFSDRSVTVNGTTTAVTPSITTVGDRSRGIYAQSVGGGGGNGGFAVQVSGGYGVSASVAIGGSGGNGGLGGTVNIDGNTVISTFGDYSEGIFAQSVGGGGGNGGFATSFSFAVGETAAAAFSVAVGGSGGDGGQGGTVNMNSGGAIRTEGNFSTGLVAQSVGGGGGNGGFTVSIAAAAGGGIGASVGVGVGGSGGGGGIGGTVDSTFNGTITTLGDDAKGALIQSVGGGGGNGGWNVTGTVSLGGVAGAGAAVGVGGSAGSGGTGGSVTGNIGDHVDTTGDRSAGVIVQSIGGGGGSGGFNVSGSIGGGLLAGGAVAVGVGGAGGDGGDGGTVNASAMSITTRGDQSGGFLAQSVGGGGGNGGFNVSGTITGSTGFIGIPGGAIGVSVGVGGAGGDGGLGSAVTANVTGDVYTFGDQSDAIVAQSVGGGGGNGGFSVAGNIGVSPNLSVGVSVGVGGSGGGGGTSGQVDLDFTGTTITLGDQSDGIISQSIGGGGGDGGFAVSGNIQVAFSGGAAGSIGVSVGGMGGGGGTAGGATLDANNGVADANNDLLAVATAGDGARGVVVQSVGGGGGNGGFSVNAGISLSAGGAGNLGVGVGGGGGDGGAGSAVVGNVNGDVFTGVDTNGDTLADDAGAILVQSIGGGGGNGGFNVSAGIALSNSASGNIMVGVGGFGGDGGNSGSASGTLTSDVYTTGDRSFGVTYQSLGGGGGNGAFNVSGGIAGALGGGAGNLGVGVGGFGGDAGNSSFVDVTMTGNVTTKGDDSHGILLQSIAGGGGNGGFNITGGITASNGVSGTIGVGVGGFAGGGGEAGYVEADLTGDVMTSGDNAFGAMMQSLGGSGGNGGFNITGGISFTAASSMSGTLGVGIGGFGGAGGNANYVTSSVTGTYVTTGDNADGVIAQSLGGGGGNGGFNITGNLAFGQGTTGTLGVGIGGFGAGAGNGAAVTLTRIGDTSTSGANSDGIFVQSLGGGGGNGAFNVTGNISGTTGGSAASLGFGLGGFGGDGGDGGNVSADVTGNVYASGTETDRIVPQVTVNLQDLGLGIDQTVVVSEEFRERAGGSNGVVVQSIGGGGGNGGFNITGDIALTLSSGTSSSRTASIGIGGFGGAGGDAGTANLTLRDTGDTTATVRANGDDRSAVIIQSVGGGGGNGGFNISGNISQDGSLAVGVGGFGADGGIARTVTGDVNANIYAAGNNARGILAQSVGGGGGSGGFNVSGSLTPNSGTNEPTMAVGIGGFGGAGNISGDVSLTHNGQVWVEGQNSAGILAQSVAGGGGSGGFNLTASATLAGNTSSSPLAGVSVAVGIGGSAGAGADAGNVAVVSTGQIVINGEWNAVTSTLEAVDYTGGSHGIVAQSIGGGGGQGGMNITANVAPSGSPLSAGVGGSGGAGGNAGTVSLIRGFDDVTGAKTANPALVQTFGDDSGAIIAQSIGGGGGNAGMNFSIVATTSSGATDKSLAANIAVGGSGAAAGNGAAVTVDHAGNVITDGNDSTAIFAQSVGGGGGSASYNVGAGLTKDANVVNVAVGGGTGSGGSASTVDVIHDGTIVTQGDRSIGIFAQSVGGGGGSAGTDFVMGYGASNSIDVIIGVEGGAAGTADDVSVDFEGTISTSGEAAKGIFAQSVGGGGGNSSATSVGLGAASGDETSGSVSVAVGLDGAVGGTAGNVVVDATDRLNVIQTSGDDAIGIHAQSVGGSGGSGGAVFNVITQDSFSMFVSVGGEGGQGGTPGTVTVTHLGELLTFGERADGILAQSIGGGGGTGGNVFNLGLPVDGPDNLKDNQSAALTFSLGGRGGQGNDGNTVTVTNTGLIGTSGNTAYGIRAQSIGGGGGDGGAIMNWNAASTSNSLSVDLQIGGSGNTGGDGGAVNVTNSGTIVTLGRDSAGISGNSIGGGGGDGGVILDAELGISGSQNNSMTVNLNFGGSGGTGGDGGDVTVGNVFDPRIIDSATIITQGEGAYGVFAQSLGGGGGNGSSIISATGQVASESAAVVGLNLGGSGGTGGDGGTVVATNSGLIDTSGSGAHGILAQSIGGGGGNGGMVIAANVSIGTTAATPLIAIGGVGGDGGDGGDVTVTNSGNIVTRGANAHGIVAQSIGGGGGNASMGFALTGEPVTFVTSNSLSALIGATGGGIGGTGGAVTVNHSGDITVLGEGSQAIVAQSINGGGGSLQLSFEGIADLSGDPSLPVYGTLSPDRDDSPADPLLAARSGANNASGMNANSVTVNSTGTFGAGGNNSIASYVNAIGGGGGQTSIIASIGAVAPTASPAEGSASNKTASSTEPTPVDVRLELGGEDGTDNNGAAIDNAHSGSLVTTGTNSPGILMQSVGGGGGLGRIDLTAPAGALLGPVDVYLGGINGTNEAGGSVSRSQSGSVSTAGAFSPGAVLQSVGGGGGFATVNISAVDQSLHSTRFQLGANGGTGLGGDTISGVFSGGINTAGDRSVGLFAQSVGAGGGFGLSTGSNEVGVTLGGQSTATGNGADVTVSNSGTIGTTGTRSHGVLLQSVGGGGGTIFTDAATVDVTLSDEGDGDGGAISFVQDGSIVTEGEGTYGIVLQSIGGGGGWIDGVFAGTAGGNGAGGDVSFAVTGDIWSTSADSTSVFAQSMGGTGNGNIVGVLDGFVRGGTGIGRGVYFDGGANNTLTTNGTLSAVSTWAIETTSGNDTINNNGIVAGNMDLGSGDNSFNNNNGATYIAFSTIDLRDPAAAPQTSANVASATAQQASANVATVAPVSAASMTASLDDSAAPTTSSQAAAAQPASPEASTTAPASSEAVSADTSVADTAPAASSTTSANGVQTVSSANMTQGSATIVSAANMTQGSASFVSTADMTQGSANTVTTANMTEGSATQVTADDMTEGSANQVTTDQMTQGNGQSVNPTQAQPDPAHVDLGAYEDGSDKLSVQVSDTPSAAPTTTVNNGAMVSVAAALNFDAPDLSPVHARDLGALSAAPGSPATFTNSGDFLMGLSATTLPIDLRAGDTFYNLDAQGTPETNIWFGARVINQVDLDGNFTQTADGRMVYDVAYGPYGSDQVTLTGDVTVDGTGDATFVWLSDDVPLPLFVSTGGTATDNGLEITDTLAVDFSITTEGGNILLNIDTDFGGVNGLNRNESVLGAHMDSNLQVGGAEGTGRLLAWLGNLQDEDAYNYLMTELNPEPHIAPLQGLLNTATSFSEDVLSCGTGSAVARSGECTYFRFDAGISEREGSFDRFETDADTFSLRAGYERPLNDLWRFGVAIGAESVQYRSIDGDRARTQGEGVTLGTSLLRHWNDGGMVAFSLTGGWMQYETERQINVFGPVTAISSPDAGYVDLRARGAHRFAREDGLYIMPRLDVGVTSLIHDGFAETGAEGIGVRSEGETQYLVTALPAVEMGWEYQGDDGSTRHLFATVGGRFSSEDHVGLPIRFAEAPAATQAADIITEIDEQLLTFETGFEIANPNNLEISVGYRGEWGDTTTNHQAGVEIGFRF